LGLAISFPGLAGTISKTLYFSGGWQMSPLKLSAGLGGSPAATLQAAEPSATYSESDKSRTERNLLAFIFSAAGRFCRGCWLGSATFPATQQNRRRAFPALVSPVPNFSHLLTRPQSGADACRRAPPPSLGTDSASRPWPHCSGELGGSVLRCLSGHGSGRDGWTHLRERCEFTVWG
jgi:hypothetical protein